MALSPWAPESRAQRIVQMRSISREHTAWHRGPSCQRECAMSTPHGHWRSTQGCMLTRRRNEDYCQIAIRGSACVCVFYIYNFPRAMLRRRGRGESAPRRTSSVPRRTASVPMRHWPRWPTPAAMSSKGRVSEGRGEGEGVPWERDGVRRSETARRRNVQCGF